MGTPKPHRPSAIERSRASWKRTFEADPIGIMASKRAYHSRNKARLKTYHEANNVLEKWDRLIFRGKMSIMEIACSNCSEAFLVRASRTNAYPRFCPICAYLRLRASRRHYEVQGKRNPFRRKQVHFRRPRKCDICEKIMPVRRGRPRKTHILCAIKKSESTK